MITFYNSQSRQVEEFKPAFSQQVAMYVCGPTVYGPAHIGNARPAIVFDQVFRLLRHVYGEREVRYVRNITDVDDKIIAASIERGVPISQITDTALAAYHMDLEALACLPPTVEPRATQHIPGMIAMIIALIDHGYAYAVDGEVFFHVPSNPHPGLANHTHTEAGSRVEVDPKKKDPRDFVLWKPAKLGEPSWFSPWGQGRPGWHIECSAMINHTFARPTIDIHGGGQDLRFPHHEAECAQSQCHHNGAPLANYWIHNGLLTVNGEKMSKSRGNVILLNELFDQYPAESVRYLFMQSHYRSPMDFTMDKLDMAHRALDGLYEVLYRHDELNYAEDVDVPAEIISALSQDLNTTTALSVLHRLADDLDHAKDKAPAKARLIKAGQFLGLFNHTPHQWRTLGVDKEAVEALIAARQEARRAKNYGEADRIRQQLTDMGITLADGVHGTEWRKS
jgi:cysteinyl-tRNA synthetase